MVARFGPIGLGLARVAGVVVLATAGARAQDLHNHTPAVSGVPQGVPYFCANPTVTTVRSGPWSVPGTWSTGRVPGAKDKVRIGAGHDVLYSVMSDAAIGCVEVDGRLSFDTHADTRLKVGNFMVMEGAALEVGSEARPVAPGVTAEIVIADQPLDLELDPAQIGTGVEGLGKVTMHGTVKTPTFVRLAKEPHAGDTTLVLEQPVGGWKAGDRLVVPDTRQLGDGERGSNYAPQDERLQIASVSGAQVTLSAPLKYDHKGARNGAGTLEFLPHVGNVSRNVVIRSENPEGTRGHMIFMSRAEVDLQYVEVRDMGRTRMGVLDSTVFDASGQVTHVGTNQIGRYAIHFHHDFGPTQAPANGYQFTLVGNSVDSAPKWGITVHNSHYGLVRDNVVYNTRGAGIVTEDGTESFNVFDHNFALRSQGSGDFAPRSGYGGPGPDPGGEGAGFWFRGPNNYIRNNVAANADAFGFGLAAGSLGTVRVPSAKGADTSVEGETVALDTTNAAVLEFADNEAYGAMQAGAAFGWNGLVANLRAWHTSRQGLNGSPTDRLVVDGLVVRGDKALLLSPLENPTGVWLSNYAAKTIVVRNADVQGTRTGVSSQFYQDRQSAEPGRGDGSAVIEHGYFRSYIGVVVATSYTSNTEAGVSRKKAVVRDSRFDPLDVPADAANPPAAISMNYRMAPGDPEPRDPIAVFNFNGTPGDDFKIYYSLEAPTTVSPCHDQRPGIGGWICK